MTDIFKKLEKNCENYYKIACFSDRLFGSSHGVQRGADGGGGGNSAGDGAIVGGSTVGVSSTSKNHPSQHKFKSPNQFELKQSSTALRALNAR